MSRSFCVRPRVCEFSLPSPPSADSWPPGHSGANSFASHHPRRIYRPWRATTYYASQNLTAHGRWPARAGYWPVTRCATRTHCFGQLSPPAGESAARRRISSGVYPVMQVNVRIARRRSCTSHAAAYAALPPSVTAPRRGLVRPVVFDPGCGPSCAPARGSDVDQLRRAPQSRRHAYALSRALAYTLAHCAISPDGFTGTGVGPECRRRHRLDAARRDAFHARRATLSPDGHSLYWYELTLVNGTVSSTLPAEAGYLDVASHRFTRIGVASLPKCFGASCQDSPGPYYLDCCQTDGRYLIADSAGYPGPDCGGCYWSYDLRTGDLREVVDGNHFPLISTTLLDHGVFVFSSQMGIGVADLAAHTLKQLAGTTNGASARRVRLALCGLWHASRRTATDDDSHTVAGLRCRNGRDDRLAAGDRQHPCARRQQPLLRRQCCGLLDIDPDAR